MSGEVTRWKFLQVAEVTPVQACLVTWSHGDYVPSCPNFISVAVIWTKRQFREERIHALCMVPDYSSSFQGSCSSRSFRQLATVKSRENECAYGHTLVLSLISLLLQSSGPSA